MTHPLFLPCNRFFPVSFQVFVRSAEMLVPEETVVGGKRGWMSRCQNQMFVPVNKSSFFLGVSSPKDENQMGALLGKATDSRIGEFLPSTTLV